MESNKSNDDNLINQLMEETYQSLPDDVDEATPEAILNYYNQHDVPEIPESNTLSFEKYISNEKCSHYKIEYQEKTMCFRMKSNDQLVDFPSNWSYFSEAREALDLKILFVVEINEETDPVFYEVMNESFFKGQKILLTHYKGSVKFLGFDSQDELERCVNIYQLENSVRLDDIAA
jgi:hypothetical protein